MDELGCLVFLLLRVLISRAAPHITSGRGTGAQTAARPVIRSHPFARRALSFSPPKSPLDQSVNFGPCPKRAQTKWHEPSFGGSSWHERAGQRLDHLRDQHFGLH